MTSSRIDLKTELKVLALVLLAVAGLECVMHAAPWAQKNYLLALAPAYRQTARNLAKTKSPAGRRVLVMGNSMIKKGLDLKRFSEQLKAAGTGDVTAEKACLEGTCLCEWYYILHNFFSDPKRKPNLILMGLTSDFMSDRNPVNPGFLPAFCSPADLPELFREDFSRFDDRVNLSLCFLSPTFRYRDSFRHEFFNRFIPGYAANKQQLNAIIRKAKSGASQPAPVESFQRLSRFLQASRDQQSDMIVVAMPLRDRIDPIDPRSVKLITDAGFRFMDCRRLPGLTPKHFGDPWHMNDQGIELFTRVFTQQLVRQYPDALGLAPALNVAQRPAARQAATP